MDSHNDPGPKLLGVTRRRLIRIGSIGSLLLAVFGCARLPADPYPFIAPHLIASSQILHQANPTAPTHIPDVQATNQPPENNPDPMPLNLSTPSPRGYLTTPEELTLINEKASIGIEPYADAVASTLEWAKEDWRYSLKPMITCNNSQEPDWIDNEEGIPIVYSKALAYHLTGDSHYAEQVKAILQQIMTEVLTISIDDQQCRLNFSWGTPELVASADLIETYWSSSICTGPTSTSYGDNAIGKGNCKVLFQNWLVKNPYYIVSLTAEESQSNWGAAATNTIAYIADYLWDRADVRLTQRNPPEINGGLDTRLTPGQAFAHAKQLELDRMDGIGVEYASNNSCDYLTGPQQSSQWPPVKSQITENGIIPEDARREEFCNIPYYDGEYENYPQLHLGQVIQLCELLLRRGDPSCYDHVNNVDVPEFSFLGPRGIIKTTHLFPGRGSVERAIKAIIVDSHTPWKHDSALEVAYHYYYLHHTLARFEDWESQLDYSNDCGQDICFGTLTHGFSPGENPELPPTVSPPHNP